LVADNPLASIIYARPIHADSSSGDCFNIAFDWLRERRDGHEQCSKELPTRVIDVGAYGIPPRLIIAQQGQVGNWVALSHCWGKDAPSLKTITANLDALCQELPVDDLPLTWKDAILVTRRLGFRYLWIDSLCIIQDSKDDWLMESARIQIVYKGASLTLMAEASPDSTSGIFKPSIFFPVNDFSW
jgi:hypothetical protein